jgi:hypothetical protein
MFVAMALSGCTLHLVQVRENSVIDVDRYAAIELGHDRRRDVMSALGPPDRVVYGRSVLVFDYLWKRHRGTDARIFLPSEIVPGFDPFFLLGIPRLFFDPSRVPDEFKGTHVERMAAGISRLATSVVPFSSGQDLLIARGHQLRHERLRIVFDRESLVAQAKSLRSASGVYRDESLTNRVLLRAD